MTAPAGLRNPYAEPRKRSAWHAGQLARRRQHPRTPPNDFETGAEAEAWLQGYDDVGRVEPEAWP